MRRLLNIAKFFMKDPFLICRKIGVLFRNSWSLFLPVRGDYRIWNKMNLAQWLVYHQRNIVFEKCYWMGTKILKNPFDAWIYQEIIYEIKPDVIIEIGSAEGGSTLYFSNLLDIIGKGNVISIDISRKNFKVKHPRIIEITGDSSSPAVLSRVAALCKDKTVLITHDGDHNKEQVLRDLINYSKLVSINSYFIVEDGIVDLYRPANFPGWSGYDKGPLAATEDFLRNNMNFIVDKERERYILTYNPKGFLKRIK